MNLIKIGDFLKKYSSIILLLVGFLIGSLMTWNHNKPSIKTTVETQYVIKNRIDTIMTKPIVKYKYKNKIVRITNKDTVINNFKPINYEWTYVKTDTTKNKKSIITVSANGWGNLDRLDYVITTKDSTKIITKTIEKTIIKNTNTLYLSGTYNTKKNFGVGVDWTIKNKLIIGSVVEYDRIDKTPIAGIKLGIKL